MMGTGFVKVPVYLGLMPKAGDEFHKTDTNYPFGKGRKAAVGPTAEERVAKAIEILTKGLKYHEYDGHSMSKSYVEDALVVLGVPYEDQP